MKNSSWKSPTIREIAQVAGVAPATVDRVLNNRAGVHEKSRKRVTDALNKLKMDSSRDASILQIRLFCESGETFSNAMASAAQSVDRSVPGVRISGDYVETKMLDPARFASNLLSQGGHSDGVIVVAREHPAINSAIRKLEGEGVPVVCVTTDLPSSRRSAYVGNDQYAAGSVAGQLIGKALKHENGRVLLVTSMPYRCQQEREMGFRRVLRADFPHLKVDERLIADDTAQRVFECITQYLDRHDAPAAIYNVAGANRGVAMALQKAGCEKETVFVGHELTAPSKLLLEEGIMDYVISHDFEAELEAAIKWISMKRKGVASRPWISPILVHTRYNCEL